MPSNNSKSNVGLWIVIGLLSAVIIFAGGFFLIKNSANPIVESAKLVNSATIKEQVPVLATPIVETPVENIAPSSTPETNINVEVVIDAEALRQATVDNVPMASDGIIYQADVYEYLTLRNAPSTSAKAICLLPPYTRLQIIEKINETMSKVYLIDSKQEGYVNNDYLTPEGAIMQRAGKQAPVAISDVTIYYADVYDSLTLRRSASTSASALAHLAPYTPLQVISYSNGMAYVYVLDSGLSGYVNTEYIVSNINHCMRAGQVAPANSGATNYSTYWADVNEFLTLRDAPRTSGNEITKLSRGTTMTVLEWTNAEFCYVQVDYTGTKGYVMSKYLLIAAQ